MDYMEEIAANNARIAELKAELSRLGSTPQPGSDALDYALAANRAEYGDISGAQWHLSKPAERTRLEKLARINETADKESDYASLQDKVQQAEDELAWTPPKNTAAVKNAERKLRDAQVKLKIFEQRNPNLAAMHWNWRRNAEKELASTPVPGQQPASQNTIEGLKAMIAENSYTDPGSGQVFWKDTADPYSIYAYGSGITNAMESPEVREQLDLVKQRQKMQQAVEAPTMNNLKVFLAKPEKTTASGRLRTPADKAEAKELYNSLSAAEKESEEGQKLKRLIDRKTQTQVDKDTADMRAEGLALLKRVPPKSAAEADLIKRGEVNEFMDEWNRVWKRDAKGNWSTPNWIKRL